MLDHVSLPEAVGRALRHRILNNEIPADTRLVEASLAAEFGVSRATIRDAMRSLQAEGLIAIVPRRYSVVTRMSLEDAEDVCFARYALELASLDRGFGPGRRDLDSVGSPSSRSGPSVWREAGSSRNPARILLSRSGQLSRLRAAAAIVCDRQTCTSQTFGGGRERHRDGA